MKNNKLAVSIATVVATSVAVGLVLYFMNQKKNVRNRLVQVADAGYETAQDILYPMKAQRFRRFRSF